MPLVAEEYSVSDGAATVCPYCGAGCRVLLEDGTAFPVQQHAVSQGALCLRGWGTGELLRSPLRVRHARVRARGGPPKGVPTDDALMLVADRLRRIRDRYGGPSIGILGSARTTYEESVVLRRLAHTLDTPHLDSLQRLGCVGAPPADLAALEDAPRLLVVAANLTLRQPQIGRRVLRAMQRGARVRFVHSRRVQLAALSAEHVRCLPGHELEAAERTADGDLILVSSELALYGQGARAVRRLASRTATFLTDYANQRGLVQAGIHPANGSLSAYEMLQRAAEGNLRALVVFADDPCEFFPALTARAFERLELVVVVDAVKTRTATLADVLLPGALLAEKQGTVINCEGREQEVRPVQPPLGGLTEGDVARRLCELLGGREMTLPERAPFVLGEDGPSPEAPSPDFPFLAALDTATFWSGHALIRSTVTAWREGRAIFADFPPGFVSLCPDDARALRVAYGGSVRVESPTGSVTLPARLDGRVLEGTVWFPMHCWERVGGALGALGFDAGLRIPVFRPRAVRLTRVEG